MDPQGIGVCEWMNEWLNKVGHLFSQVTEGQIFPWYKRSINRRRFKNTANAVLSLEILVTSDFDKVAGTAIYNLQYYYL